MLDIILDALIDSLKILPFLFFTYLILEYIEHKTSGALEKRIKNKTKFAPVIGSILGVVPQCGFSVAATNLYAARIITLGTLIAIYLSTSDEMLPILISEGAPINVILSIIGVKILIAIIAGFIIDFIINIKKKNKEEISSADNISTLCEHEHCHCESGIFKSALKHTINIFIFIFIITLILNAIITLVGEDTISQIILNQPILGPIIAGVVGLIPNCASSVILTELYIQNIINFATMISGLLVNSGVALIVLFKVNKNIKENLKIIFILYLIGVISGILLGI